MDPSTASPGRPRLARAALIAICCLVPIVPIVVGALILSASKTLPPTGGVIRPLSAILPRTVPSTPSYHQASVVVVTHATTLHGSPNGPVIAQQPLRTSFGSPTVLLVRRVVPGWLAVLSPLVGNGRVGWIATGAVTITQVNWALQVSLAKRQLSVLEDGKLLERYKIAIGRPTAPTPTGLFAVTDRLQTGDPTGPYGCCILALSALAPHAIQGWNGGNRIAIHSTPETSSIGLPVSHGCMRLTLAEGRWLIDHVPLGTPTQIKT